MALYGNFETFALTDLLQWVETARKSGTLVIEHESVSRTVLFRDGKLVGCSSTDPPFLLGQILLARGRITEEQLRSALSVQESKGGNLGTILVELGAISSEDVVRHVAAKAEETIYGLFDWEDASFEFLEDAPLPEHHVEISLPIQDILLRGLKRYDEMRRIREVFHDTGIVLARSDQELPENIRNSKATARILDLVNGERTLAELLLHARASEYLVWKFLFELHRKGYVRITEIRANRAEPAKAAAGAAGAGGVGVHSVSGSGGPMPSRDDGASSPSPDASASGDPAAEIEFANRLLERGEHDAAVAVLHAAARAHPGVSSIRQTITKVEESYVDMTAAEIPEDKVPVVVSEIPRGEKDGLSPDAAYLVSLINGQADVKSILWVAPMRKVDGLRGLQKLLHRGVIELCDAV
jgi:hypothetical protein